MYLRNDDTDGADIQMHTELAMWTTANLFKMSGAAVSWKSRKQHVLLSQQQKPNTLHWLVICKEVASMRQLLVHNGQTEPTIICEDNQSAICITQNPQYHNKTNTLILSTIMLERKFWTPLSSFNIIVQVT